MLSLPRRCIAACLLGACFITGMSVSASAQLLPERVEKAAQDRIAAGSYQTLVFGIVDGDRSEVVGFGKLDSGKPPDGDTLYEIGSITKTFTATLLAAAVLSGQVKLDTPVAELLPDFRIPSRNGREITLGDLATQHSGLPRLPSNLLGRTPSNPYADYDAAKLKAFLAGYDLPRDPGSAYEYSNLGFGLLGYALARSSHATYDALAVKEILEPLGMSATGTELPPAVTAHLAPGHDGAGRAAGSWDFDALAGAGALRSTANDMLCYLKANMGVDRSPLAAAMTLAQQPRSDVTKTLRIGLAWMTTGTGIVWHNGMTGGYASFIGFSPARRRGVVILSNTALDTDDLGFAVLDANASLTPTYKAISLPDASLDEYVGTYKLGENFLLNVFHMRAGLFARATGQVAFPIFPSAPNEFFAKIAGIGISFTRDAGGLVTGLVLHQNGNRTAPKLSAAELPRATEGSAVDAGALGDYVGQYRFDFGILDIALDRDHLEAQLTGQPPFPIFASARDKFFYKVVDARLDFERDAEGKISAVVLHQNGRDLRAPRASGP
ncbi:serine hydrolase [Labrys wisconsinensis]|nr:serine hydrolase [Labrys wisconsinensis]